MCSYCSRALYITLPGWRGQTLITNATFPNGMQSAAPCGGIGLTQNMSAWPIDGPGAIAIQPGWFAGNMQTEFFINIGFGEDPETFDVPLVAPFRVYGPSNRPFPGTFCLPDIFLPDGKRPRDGDYATIQVIQVHQTGNAAHNCVGIVFTNDDDEIPGINPHDCFNSAHIMLEPLSDIVAGEGVSIGIKARIWGLWETIMGYLWHFEGLWW
ncbi:hypothetical protein B0I35DRAFT_449504 [Stachybotrys elegans]|uniref:Copper acquisition factor BIM1-like domain-containing protein n=1 Tax=Stachybotrys elegans TaxID=80388 RepID=A0A8K0T0W6_9HYPO|nr:hypothetical protein B0I35DRAFT_449504 [Stachybotrys elegans]